MSGPLHGVKVVELGVWVAGPAAAGVLGDCFAQGALQSIVCQGAVLGSVQ